MKKLLMLAGFACVLIMSFSFSNNDAEKINWISMSQLDEMYAKNPRPVLVDIYTDWCGWCKQMDKTTYRDDKLAAYINEHYYAVKFNAESTENITFNKKLYRYNKQYRVNELAVYLTSGRLAFPTTVVMSGVNGDPAPLPGYMKPKQLEAPIKFYGDKANETQSYVEFYKKFHSAW